MLVKGLLLSLLLLQAEASPFNGKGISGDGHACSGDLRIFPQYLNWETSFSNCDHMPYKTLQSNPNGPWAYQFTEKKKGCLYTVLVVQHPDGDDEAWDVIGYETVTAWKKQLNAKFIECPMY